MAMSPKPSNMENTVVHYVDERKGCRSLLCDSNGIIIAEMVYRCMVCFSIHDYIGDVTTHYHNVHMNDGNDGDDDESDDVITNEEDTVLCNRTISKNKTNNHRLAINKKTRANNQDNSAFHTNTNHSNNIDNNNNPLDDNSNNCQSSWEIDDTLNSNLHSKFNSPILSNSVPSNNSSESCTRSGFITCPVCCNVRCYTTLQRRYGQFTCVACYRFFKEFFQKPTRFSCPFLGKCPLDIKSKCKACWIAACSKIYSVDGHRKSILIDFAPIKSPENLVSSTSSLVPSTCPPNIIDYHLVPFDDTICHIPPNSLQL